MNLRTNRVPGQPSVKLLAGTLVSLKPHILSATFFNEDETRGMDVRLQVVDGGWRLWTGDPQYDTDHRGVWASCYLTPGDNCRTVARDMLAGLE